MRNFYQKGAVHLNITIKGIATNYITEGNGEPLLILPGWGATSAVYNLIVKQLSEKFKVSVLDLPGFGITPEPSEPWGIDDYADFVTEFIKEMGIESLAMAGHSYGGRIIINLCSRDLPFEINRVILIDSAGSKNPLSKEAQKKQAKYKKIKKLFGKKPFITLFPGMVEKLQKKYGSSDYANASPVMRQTLVKSVSQDYTDKIPNITQEALLIWGELDTATPLSDALTMNKLIKNSKLEVIKGAGHFPFIDAPFEFRKILKNYFGLSQ